MDSASEQVSYDIFVDGKKVIKPIGYYVSKDGNLDYQAYLFKDYPGLRIKESKYFISLYTVFNGDSYPVVMYSVDEIVYIATIWEWEA